MASEKQDASLMSLNANPAYDELIRSIPEAERAGILKELESPLITGHTEWLKEKLAAAEEITGLILPQSRILFLAALRGIGLKQISAAQLATLHILDSAIRTLYTNPMVYFIHKYVNAESQVVNLFNTFLLTSMRGMPTSIKKLSFRTLTRPKEGMPISDLPWRMQKPLIQRFFNLIDSEWLEFCREMEKAPQSEQFYHILNAPEEGCWSSIIFKIQKTLKCMRVLDWMVASKDGLTIENIMLAPSFTMFQAAINAKAKTLNRKPVELIPTYGYIEAEHYATLKASGKIAFALYLPEQNETKRYQPGVGNFRTTIDGHPVETAFAGAIHDVYHAMREMSMSENVAKARMRLASIAKNHPKNKMNADSRSVYNILIDGELIFSYPPAFDTMFDLDYRSPQPQSFGVIFHISSLKSALHEDLKRAFIEDMVVNKTLWQEQFNLGWSDLEWADQLIYNQIQLERSAANGEHFSAARAMSDLGLLAGQAPAAASIPSSTASPKY